MWFILDQKLDCYHQNYCWVEWRGCVLMWCITYRILRHLQTFKRFFWKLVNKRVSKCTSSFRLVKVTLNCNKSFHFIYDSNLNLQICNCLHFANPFIHSSCSLNEIKIFLSNNRSQCTLGEELFHTKVKSLIYG